MTVIDFHTHFFPDELAARAIYALREQTPVLANATDGTLAGLLRSMDKSGVSQSVTLPVATKAEQVEGINTAAQKLIGSRIIPFGALYPHAPNSCATVDTLVASGIAGVKLHPEYQNFYAADKRFFPLYECLAHGNLAVVMHAGNDPGPFSCDHATPDAIAAISRAFPTLKLVAAHMGGFYRWDDVESHLCGTSVYFDTAAVYGHLPPEAFMRIVDKHGIDYILFGTDSPWFDQRASIEWIDRLPLGDAAKESIFSGNAKRLLSLH